MENTRPKQRLFPLVLAFCLALPPLPRAEDVQEQPAADSDAARRPRPNPRRTATRGNPIPPGTGTFAFSNSERPPRWETSFRNGIARFAGGRFSVNDDGHIVTLGAQVLSGRTIPAGQALTSDQARLLYNNVQVNLAIVDYLQRRDTLLAGASGADAAARNGALYRYSEGLRELIMSNPGALSLQRRVAPEEARAFAFMITSPGFRRTLGANYQQFLNNPLLALGGRSLWETPLGEGVVVATSRLGRGRRDRASRPGEDRSLYIPYSPRGPGSARAPPNPLGRSMQTRSPGNFVLGYGTYRGLNDPNFYLVPEGWRPGQTIHGRAMAGTRSGDGAWRGDGTVSSGRRLGPNFDAQGTYWLEKLGAGVYRWNRLSEGDQALLPAHVSERLVRYTPQGGVRVDALRDDGTGRYAQRLPWFSPRVAAPTGPGGSRLASTSAPLSDPVFARSSPRVFGAETRVNFACRSSSGGNCYGVNLLSRFAYGTGDSPTSLQPVSIQDAARRVLDWNRRANGGRPISGEAQPEFVRLPNGQTFSFWDPHVQTMIAAYIQIDRSNAGGREAPVTSAAAFTSRLAGNGQYGTILSVGRADSAGGGTFLRNQHLAWQDGQWHWEGGQPTRYSSPMRWHSITAFPSGTPGQALVFDPNLRRTGFIQATVDTVTVGGRSYVTLSYPITLANGTTRTQTWTSVSIRS